MASPVIAPSILAADFACFAQEAKRAEKGGGDWLHVDIMDGHFVPNISFGPAATAALHRSTRLPLDVHLMIERPDLYLNDFSKAGSYRITVHVEAQHDVHQTLWRIRQKGCRPGIALNPATASSMLEEYLEEVDLVLCMTVVPGFGGQSWIPSVLKKIEYFAHHPSRQKHPYYVEVDGGINIETATACAEAGADVFVAGTSLFETPNMGKVIREMRKRVLREMKKRM